MSSKIVVLIATNDRSGLLKNRALVSVLKQTLLPDFLIIIDDSSDDDPSEFKEISSKIPNCINFTALKNARTKGASGAWNTGLIYAFDQLDDQKNWYVAILDDDDEWSKNHLETCKQQTPKADMVVSGLIRHDRNGIIKENVPDELILDDFLIGNPGIQGSNMFIRLNSFFEAGLFDENLRSTTDRDLCIRLSEISSIVKSTNTYTVHHYAEENRERLSKYGSPQKLGGLLGFWKKYHTRMDSNQQQAFLERSHNLFGFSLPAKEELQEVRAMKMAFEKSFNLVIGVISADSDQLVRLLNDLVKIHSFPYITELRVLIMNNGGDEDSMSNLSKMMINKGLNCYYMSHQQQADDAMKGAFGEAFIRGERQLSIGKARTLLQRYLYEFVAREEDTFAWVLDDDMRIDERAKFYLSWLPSFKSAGVDILLGSYEGASPNPAASGVRVQLVDIVNNLKWMFSLDPSDVLPDRSSENQKLRTQFPDYYYDLSKLHTAHLETVYWFTPSFNGETVGEARSRLLKNLNKIFSGAPVTRPVIKEMPFDPIQESKNSINRGGTTFILNPLALKKTPNSVVEISGKEARRSDMIWALISRAYYGFKIRAVNFPVIHDRDEDIGTNISVKKIIGEIQGSSLVTAMREVVGNSNQHDFNFDHESTTKINKKFKSYLNDRILSFKTNFLRIQGLCKMLEAMVESQNLQSESKNLQIFHEKLVTWYCDQNRREIEGSIREMSNNSVETFLKTLKPQIDLYANSQLNINFFDQLIPEQKTRNDKMLTKTLTNWCELPTDIGNFRMYDTGDENIRLISYGDLTKLSNNPLIRIHSSCIASETFGSQDCDCSDQLKEAMGMIKNEREGLIFHLHQEGRGQGLSNKIRAINLMQQRDLDTVEAFDALGLEQDTRCYKKVTEILNHLNVNCVRLVTNNPRKIYFLTKANISVSEAVNTTPKIRKENEDYLYTKQQKLGHAFSLDQ